MTAPSSRRLRVIRQKPAEAAVLSCASEQNASSYNGDSAKRQSCEQECHNCSCHRDGVEGSKSKHGVTLTHRSLR